ncbi:MAG TPA: hypothetical protein VFU73_15710 [Actinocrinis sp.]|nr:hypothetical protein [Actinocrinis sp.]
MRLLVAPGAALRAPMWAAVLVGTLAACSTGTAAHNVAATRSAGASPSAAKTFSPLDGPTEDASLLPKTCTAILTEANLQTAFGSPQSGDNDYGTYAPLPSIGRTGRVTCGFGIGIDEMGNPTDAAVTVSVITYTTAQEALTRLNATIGSSVGRGSASQPASVGGHPATILVEPPSPPSAAASATASAPAGASAPPVAGASPTGTAAGGDTELVMADGNRTFVLLIPTAKLSGSGAVNVLLGLAALVYHNTLPPGTAPAASAAAGSASATG